MINFTQLFKLVCIAANCVILLHCGNLPAHSLQLSKSLAHYAVEMEFYYQKPRPEMIPGLLDSLAKSGQLAKGENRLMTAAFLSELISAKIIDINKLLKNANSRDITRTLAWSAHLAQNDAERVILNSLSKNGDALLARQIASSPAPLSSWDPLLEKSSLQMYWGAFMASGQQKWLDSIIQAALAYARAAERGAKNEPAYIVGSTAAASLYEFAPGHTAIVNRLKNYLDTGNKAERDMIQTILQHASK